MGFKGSAQKNHYKLMLIVIFLFNKIITIIEKFSWKIDFFWIKKDFLTNIIYNKYIDLNKSNEEKSK